MRGQATAGLDLLARAAPSLSLEAAPTVLAAMVATVDFYQVMLPDVIAPCAHLRAVSERANAHKAIGASHPRV